ncbi:hypothetical protein [Paenibacillus macquariensis]|uniref:Spo0E like sporulation regulatory protein n=1 Tax=Paenibacillus macquariensis TaxID=948756 RepID=A0ABY1JK36_9BACL|nr:hypothetical protein [Paenibacillus macquariensis]MEC0089852.1 hypothetical protein [Paenibacillus macquariensis]OAB30684.1 hypothetical protein PMSM_21300 [Paenibacillus macquariensis subsp. macquariensis]SIQ32665.1 hypothetical protein SAMN05421578_101232 [Paenibacillus macquariensis]
MNATLEQYKERIAAIEREGSLDLNTQMLLNHLLEDLEKCVQLNLSLRKSVSKSNSKESRMSSKLRDALYE